MALTPSYMLPLGTKAPNFSLPDTISNKTLSLDALKSESATVIMFICNHCPYVVHILDKLVCVAKDYTQKGVSFIAISSNNIISHPADKPENMQKTAEKYDFYFPYLYDETQQVAKDYHAACTPDFFVFDKNLECVYRGRFDDSSPGKINTLVTGKDLISALDNILQNKAVNAEQFPSMGCNIKWK